jgi:hypothetical protein
MAGHCDGGGTVKGSADAQLRHRASLRNRSASGSRPSTPSRVK